MVIAKVTKVQDPADFINFYPEEIEADEWHIAKLISIKEGTMTYMEETKPSWDWLYEFKDLTYINRDGIETHGQVKVQCSQTFTEKSNAYKLYCGMTGVEKLDEGTEVDFESIVGRKCKVMAKSTQSAKGNWFHKIEKVSIKGLEADAKVQAVKVETKKAETKVAAKVNKTAEELFPDENPDAPLSDWE